MDEILEEGKKTEVDMYLVNNEKLKVELWGRGYYVSEIKRGEHIEYLVVSTRSPEVGLVQTASPV